MRKNLKFMVLIFAMLSLAIGGCGQKDTSDSETDVYNEKITNVEYMKVEPTTFEENISLPIVVLPNKEIDLGMTNGGRVTKIYIDKGDNVKKGQVLLETDDTILKASHEIAKASLEYQENEFARNEKLLEDGSIAEVQFDSAKLALAQARSTYEITKKNYENATLEAPFSGIVTTKNIEVGDILAPGTPAFRIIDTKAVKVQAGIPEKYIVDFEQGNKVKITIDSIPGREFEGMINYIAPEASPAVRTFLAEMVVDNSDGSIRTGVMGNARIVRNVYKNALMVPMNAITETQKGHMVFVLKDGDIVEERNLKVLGGDDLMVQVEGIFEGEKIITKGNYDLIDGEKVNVTGEYNYISGEEGS